MLLYNIGHLFYMPENLVKDVLVKKIKLSYDAVSFLTFIKSRVSLYTVGKINCFQASNNFQDFTSNIYPLKGLFYCWQKFVSFICRQD